MEQVFGESVAGDRFVSLLIAAFGGLALVLAAIGVYGVTAYAIGQRLREFGVRMAISADRASVLRQAIGDGIRPVLVGVAAGLAAAGWASRLLDSLLHNVSPSDAVTFFGVPAVLIAVATLACALPAWRASRLDPVTVLRNE
jgi:ABC-type antimicrobial peptide transport system permease subunit